MTATVPYAGPATLEEALRLRAEHPDWLVLAGGTDVMVDDRRASATGVLDLFGIAELHGVQVTDERISVGAGTTFAELLADDRLRAAVPLLAAAAAEVGAVQIRNRGTVGGNVVTSSPVGDLLPALLVLDATAVVGSPHGTRSVAYEQFVLGYRTVDLAADELLLGLELDRPAAGTVPYWRKVGGRAAQAISKVSVAATARVAGGRLAGFRLAFGGVADRPVRLRAVEELAAGRRPDRALADEVGAAVHRSLEPISDVRSTADYRRDVAANLARRFVADLST